MTAKKSGFFTTTPTMHADYNSQSAAGGPAVNPVMATGLASPVPFLVLKPNCCTYFQHHNQKLTLEFLTNNYSYTISTLSLII